MKNKIIYIFVVIILCVVFFFLGWFLHKPKTTINETETYTSNLGFSFNYPKDMFIQNISGGTDDNFRIAVIPTSYNNQKQDLDAVVISASPNDPSATPMDWLNSPDSGADMSKGYSKLNMDGQEAISLNGDNWVVVDTSDNKYQISVATLPSDKPSQLLHNEMSSIIASFKFTK